MVNLSHLNLFTNVRFVDPVCSIESRTYTKVCRPVIVNQYTPCYLTITGPFNQAYLLTELPRESLSSVELHIGSLEFV
jgi:hypothetical protein